MSDTNSELGARVRLLLDSTGVSAREASRIAGYPSEAYVGMLSRGTVDNPRILSLDALATAFGCASGWLAYGEGEAPADHALRSGLRATCVRLLGESEQGDTRRESAAQTLKELDARFPGALGHTCSDFTAPAAPIDDVPEDDDPSGPVVVTEGYSQVVGG